MSDALYVIAKAPRVGLAKTRLGRTIGHERAVALYKAFLRDLGARFSNSSFNLGWYVTPPDSWPEISALVPQTGPVLFQGEGDLTERQRELFRGAAGRGEERTVLIAADSPHLGVEVVEEAFRRLDREDLVFGPTHDGGYYLIGMRGYHDVLEGATMSKDSVLEGIVARARLSGLSVGLLEATFDVDLAEDIRHLRPLALERPDLSATQDALESLGLMEQEPQPADEGDLLASGEYS
ncbi:MAG: TIGR04282 family arsenosugar biosynthesis glycosyltransferase [Actinomycetota bacterium]|nr:TIGR04282 family arsenosugar biosynthesis glycosyltransferase [Actinomycetota bacterium]